MIHFDHETKSSKPISDQTKAILEQHFKTED